MRVGFIINVDAQHGMHQPFLDALDWRTMEPIAQVLFATQIQRKLATYPKVTEFNGVPYRPGVVLITDEIPAGDSFKVVAGFNLMLKALEQSGAITITDDDRVYANKTGAEWMSEQD